MQKPSSIRTNHFLLLPPRSARKTPPRTLTHTLLRNHAAPLLATWHKRIGSSYNPFHFPALPVRSVRRNTFLSGCLPPWPPSNCLNQHTRFVNAALGPLSLIKVHSSSHTMLTTVCPLATSIHNTFRVRLASTRSLYCIALSSRRCPERHFRGNQLPGSSIGLSPLCTSHIIELHVRTTRILQQAFATLQSRHT